MIKGYYDVIKCKLNIPTIQPKLQMKEITPSTEEQYIIPDDGYDGLASAIVKAVTNEIDSNILPENIRLGKSILGIQGNLEPDKPDQNKTVIPTTEEQTVRADEGYELAKVTVNAIQTESRSVKSTKETQAIIPTSGKFINEVVVNPIVLEDITVNPSTSTQTITPSSGQDGINEVTVNPVTSTIDNNIQASNIKSGVTILGIEGTVIENEDLDTQLAAQEQLIRDLQTEVNGKAGLAFIAPNGIKFGAQNEMGSMFTIFPRMDTSNLTSLNKLFCNCPNLTTLDVSGWDTSKVTDMSYTFFGCRSLTSLDVRNFNTSNVTDMSNMFYKCSSLTSLDLSNFDTSNVTDMQRMFNNCSRLTSLDLSSFDFSKVTRHSGIFDSVSANCTIYVKDQAAVDTLTSWDNTHTYTIKP